MIMLERVLALKNRVSALGDVSARFDEATKLQDRKDEAQEVADQLAPLATSTRLLHSLKVQVSLSPATVEDGIARLLKVQERFAKDRTAAALTYRNDWPRMISKMEETARAVDQSLARAWRAHVTGLHTGDTPQHIGAHLAPTEQNEDVLDRYRAAYEDLQRCADTLPADATQAKEARTIAALLKKIDREFDRDVPAAVKLFLDAVAQGNAGLDLATEEVQNWLRSQGSYEHYRITIARS